MYSIHMWRYMYLFLSNSSHRTNRCNFNNCICVSSLRENHQLETRKGASEGAEGMGYGKQMVSGRSDSWKQQEKNDKVQTQYIRKCSQVEPFYIGVQNFPDLLVIEHSTLLYHCVMITEYNMTLNIKKSYVLFQYT